MSPRRGERLMVPKASFESYYGRPILKDITWSATDIAGYLFLGGMAGASSVVGAGAALTGRPDLERTAKYTALGGISLSLVALVHDLGRPERFVNMLRVAKPTSPMSMGTWLLTGYGPAAGATAAALATGLFPAAGRIAGLVAAGLGPAVATYTSVLIADTAVPAWHQSYRELPFLFAGSAAASAAGAGLIGAPAAQTGPVRRLALAGAAVELAATHRIENAPGVVARSFHEGRAGTLLRAARVLTAGGSLGTVVSARVPGRPGRALAAVSGAALLAGAACTRFGIFEAGRNSVRDPVYTVQPQRERAATDLGLPDPEPPATVRA
ncbi:polysulfide reductase NrfD [Kineosporia sp. J2-2]|uniref:Polysulfide reductase NrfD n=1 Tax=Kineosporia corallincola TaxID=2835133 RepID=A0ABS5TF23_9ACTN|nr:NrfD/PsrC family molybdoenzyme membrane anchor subunit [Kineosporia corallincola]MBT0769645.1 polysulfide reductase NrfD [Kineosporia corallincola]